MFIRSITRLTFDKNLEITYWRAYIMSKMTHIYINQAWNPHPIMYTHKNKKNINSICICRICAKIQLKGWLPNRQVRSNWEKNVTELIFRQPFNINLTSDLTWRFKIDIPWERSRQIELWDLPKWCKNFSIYTFT